MKDRKYLLSQSLLQPLISSVKKIPSRRRAAQIFTQIFNNVSDYFLPSLFLNILLRKMKPFVFHIFCFLWFGFFLCVAEEFKFQHIYLVYRLFSLSFFFVSAPTFILSPQFPSQSFDDKLFFTHLTIPIDVQCLFLSSINICYYCWQMQTAILTLYCLLFEVLITGKFITRYAIKRDFFSLIV